MLRAFVIFLFALWPTLAFAAPDTLAVLYFQNQGNPQLEPLKVGLAQMMITDLQVTGSVDVVERAQLQSILDELELGHSGVVDKKTAAKVGELLGARYIVMGGYFELAGTLRIDARLVEVETGKIVHAHGVNGTTADFLTLEKALANDLNAHLGGTKAEATNPKADPKTDSKADPKGSGTRGGGAEATHDGGGETKLAKHDGDTVQAALSYSEGLIFLDKKETARAREAFEKAVAEDPALEDAKAQLAALEL